MQICIHNLTAQQQAHFWSRVAVREENKCWEWTGHRNAKGYGQTRVSGTMYYTHRLAAMLDGRDVIGATVMHSCDNPSCCNPAHLSVGTPADNTADMLKRKRFRAKITEDDVRAIRASVGKQRDVAAAFGIDQALVQRIRVRTAWRYVE